MLFTRWFAYLTFVIPLRVCMCPARQFHLHNVHTAHVQKLNLHGAGRDSERIRNCGFKQRRQSGQEHHLLAAFQQLAPAHSAAHCNTSKCRAVKIENTYHVSAMRHRNDGALGLQGSVPRRFSVLTRAGIGKQSHQQRGGQDTEQGQMRLRVESMRIALVVLSCPYCVRSRT